MKSATHSLGLMLRWNVLLAGTLLSACTGGQTGGEDAVPPSLPFPGSTSDACVPETTPSVLPSLDEMTAAGFSAASVLQYAEGTFHQRLDFDPRPADGGWDPSTPLSIEPGGDEDLEIEISYEGGELRYFASESCPRLDIDVQVRLRTPSGAIEERVDGVLMASSPFEARLWLRFHTAAVEPRGIGRIAYVPAPQVRRLSGDLSVTATNHTGRHQLVFIELWLTLSKLGVNGYLDGWIYGVDDEHLRLAPLLATIGETCDGGYGIPLGPEDPPVPDQKAPSAREVLALLGGMRIDAVRDDGSRLPLSLDLEYTPDSACARPGRITPLTFDAVLAIDADLGDASINGRWPLELRVRSATDSALARVYVTLERSGEVSVERSEIERLVDDWGVAGLEVDRYDQVSITFDLTLEPGTDPPGVAGELLIRGYVLPEDRSRPVSTADGDVLGRLRFEPARGP